MNEVHLSGKIVSGVEEEVDGVPHFSFVLAAERRFVTSRGAKKTETTYITCECWDSGARKLIDHFKPGDKIYVNGILRNESKNKESTNNYKVRVSSFMRLAPTEKYNKESNRQPVNAGN